MKAQKLLSIIIPSYNRAQILLYTLSLFHDQVVRNEDEVELIVCNNGSIDDTKFVLESLLEKEAWFSCINYPDHVNIDDSIRRSIENANGNFFNLFGDDDIPAPTMVETLLNVIKAHPRLGLMTYNRLNGYSDSAILLRGLSVKDDMFDQYEIIYKDSKHFTENYYGQMGFLSVDVVNKDVWRKGLHNFDSSHLGYSFLTVMHSGVIGYECVYLQYPLCIQRNVQKGGNEHEFSNTELGLYQFIGIPRILKRLEELGAINNWNKCFMQYPPNKLDDWYYAFVSGVAEKPYNYAQYYNEIINYQSSEKRITNTKMLLGAVGSWRYPFVKPLFKFKIKGIGYLFKMPQILFHKLCMIRK